MKNMGWVFLLVVVSCASTPELNKWSSPLFRIYLEPRSIDSANYVRVRQALVQSGRYFVTDRSITFTEVVLEQNREHTGMPERFGAKERYARLGKLYGVGGIIEAHAQCVPRGRFFGRPYLHCQQYLTLIDATTGEIIADVFDEDDSAEQTWDQGITLAADWNGAVNKLNDSIPKNYQEQHYTTRMRNFRDEIGEDSQRERDSNGKPGI